ncbi:Hypothetical protein DEACI_4036 [Acididesulfobacillus acetoxydans]|uniref:Uncharacterized protein n=1 Tax=Acididesulfobacillus acetoxydans TaxID=1561005 RepID=A0A8S0VYM8_9FIRM|nr:hypothetical protein [Acididesulfobacillus acetoxydans]CAA7603213.1 Hypothetical protein DEACI_4036 [Acididesulfobacillus acetoxydans]
MCNELALKDNYPTQYNLFGIYVDWQIDNNLIQGLGVDPHGITSFSDFMEKSRWQIVTVAFAGREMLSLNLTLPKFRLLEMLKIKIQKVNKNNLTVRDATRLMDKYKQKLSLPIFDIVEYYMSNIPWNLTDRSVINHHPNVLMIDESFFNKRIIVKVMTKDGYERITSANDILDGKTDENECLIDPTHYSDETSYEMERYWSDKLGIPVLGEDEEIDFTYKYSNS